MKQDENKYIKLIGSPKIIEKDRRDYTDSDLVNIGEQLKEMICSDGFGIFYNYLQRQQEGLLDKIIGEVVDESLEAIKIKREAYVQTYRAIMHELNWIFGNIEESERIKNEWNKSDKGGK